MPLTCIWKEFYLKPKMHEGRTNSVFPNFGLCTQRLNREMCSESGDPLPKTHTVLQECQILLQSCNHPQTLSLNRFLTTSSCLEYLIKMPPDIS